MGVQQCKAKAKHSGSRCKNPVVPGFEVCRIHGGLTPVGADLPQYKHGRYSKHLPPAIQEKVDEFKEGDALDLLDELATQRALFVTYAQRFKGSFNPTLSDIDFMMGWVSEITKTVERIVKIRNSTALTAAEIAFIALRIPDVVTKYIDDPNQQKRFIDDLFGAIATTPPDHAFQLGETAAISLSDGL